jgi:hypothetical protein
MQSLYKFLVILFTATLLTACKSENSNKTTNIQDKNSTSQTARVLTLSNDKISVDIQLIGGAITSFKHTAVDVNPLSWKLTEADMPANHKGSPPFAGHFLCVGRWGSPSAAEIEAGILHNGDVNAGEWKLVYKNKAVNQLLQTQLYFETDKEQLQMVREFSIHPQSEAILVQETISNTKYTDRLFNWVQHATIGAPFLNSKTIIDCNAGLGFDQRQAPDLLTKSAFRWPNGKLIDGPVDLRTVNDDRGYVTTHIFDDSIQLGWACAYSPEHKLLIGYVFKTDEYPWLNMWHWKKDGKPHAHGLEFGTTGLGKPYPELLEHCVDFYGHKSYIILPAKGTLKKSYIVFAIPVSGEFTGTRHVDYDGKNITVMPINSDSLLSIKAPYGFW